MRRAAPRQQPAQNVGSGGGATNLAAAAALHDRLSSLQFFIRTL